MSLHYNAPPFIWDTVSYPYFQFYVKAEATSGPVALEMTFDNATSNAFADMVVQPFQIGNFAIDNTWTRVRVAATDVGLSGSINVSRIDIFQYLRYSSPPILISIDEIRFVR
jgi:hypothetical protein